MGYVNPFCPGGVREEREGAQRGETEPAADMSGVGSSPSPPPQFSHNLNGGFSEDPLGQWAVGHLLPVAVISIGLTSLKIHFLFLGGGE